MRDKRCKLLPGQLRRVLTIFQNRIPAKFKGGKLIRMLQINWSSFGWCLSAHLPIYQQVIPPTLSPAPNYYHVLGLSRDASEQEIIRAWRKAVLLHHPDKQASNQTSKSPISSSNVDIRLINEAKWILSDEKRRIAWEEGYYSSGRSLSRVPNDD